MNNFLDILMILMIGATVYYIGYLIGSDRAYNNAIKKQRKFTEAAIEILKKVEEKLK